MRGAFTAPRCRRVVRPPAAGAHAPLHARQAARRHPAGAAGAVHALPVPLAPAGQRAPATSAARARRDWPTCCASSRAMPHRPRPGKTTCSRARVHDYAPAMLTSSAPPAAWCGGGRRQATSGEAPAQRARSAARRSCCASATRWRTGSRPPAPRADDDAAAVEQGARGAATRCATHGASFFADLQRDAGLLGEPSRAGAGRAGGARPRHLRHLRRAARAGDAGRQAQQAAAPAPGPRARSTTPAAGR